MRYEASVLIDRPRAVVWQYLASPSNTPDFWVSIDAYDATSPLPLAEGTTMAGKMRRGPLVSDMKQVATRVVQDEVIEWKDLTDRLNRVESFTLSDVQGGTRVIYRAQAAPTNLMERGMAAVVTYLIHRDAWASLDRLKEILESQAADD